MSDVRQPNPQDGEPRSWSVWLARALRAVRIILAVMLLLVSVELYYTGMLMGLLMVLALVLVPVGALVRIVGAMRKGLEPGLVRHPFQRTTRPYLLQAVNRCVFWALLGVVLNVAIPQALFPPVEYRSVLVLIWCLVVALIGMELVPRRRIFHTANVLFAVGGIFLGIQLFHIHQTPALADGVVIDAPFRGEWGVFHGGRSALINHHWVIDQQRNALDLDRVVNGPPQENADQLESYAAFDQPLYAPAAGTVVAAVGDRRDNAIGETDEDQLLGNHLVIDIGQERFVLLAHLKQDSVLVAVGDEVSAGQPIARCGNSGNTSEPHLHLQIQDRADFRDTETRTQPIFFRNVVRVRRGQSVRLAAAYGRRNDHIIVEGPESEAP